MFSQKAKYYEGWAVEKYLGGYTGLLNISCEKYDRKL